MSRLVLRRITALFVGLWFVTATAAPELTHACPMHGSHAAAASVGAHAGHATSAPEVAAAAHHSVPDSESGQHRSTQCTCLGHCCCTPPVAVIGATVALADTQTIATRDAGLPDYAYVPVAAQHVLPLANAPPLSA